MYVRAAVGEPASRGRALWRGEDGEIAAFPAAPNHPDLPFPDALRVADAVVLTFHRLEGLPRLRGVVVGQDRLGEDVPQRSDETLDGLGAQGLPDGVTRETPDVVGSGLGIRTQPFLPRNLRDPGQVLVTRPGRLQLGEHGDVGSRDSIDPQEIDGHERADTTADGDELGVDDRNAGAGDHLVGPDVGRDQLRGQVAGLGRWSLKWRSLGWRAARWWCLRARPPWRLTHPDSPFWCAGSMSRPLGSRLAADRFVGKL